MPPQPPRKAQAQRQGSVQSHATAGPTPAPPIMPGKDLLQRLNYVVQANALLEGLSRDEGGGGGLAWRSRRRDATKRKGKGTGKRSAAGEERGQSSEVVGLRQIVKDVSGRAYRDIAKHAMLKLDPALKRSMCSSCNAVGIPGAMRRVRIKASSNHIHRITTTCTGCGSTSSTPCPPVREANVDKDSEPPSTPLGGASTSARSLDGPVRARRRSKAARLPPFWMREARRPEQTMATQAPAEGQANPPASSAAVPGTGPAPVLDRRDARRRAKQKRGHSIWAEGELVDAWGVPMLS